MQSCAGPGHGWPVLNALLLWSGRPEAESSPLGGTLPAEAEAEWVTLKIHLWVFMAVSKSSGSLPACDPVTEGRVRRVSFSSKVTTQPPQENVGKRWSVLSGRQTVALTVLQTPRLSTVFKVLPVAKVTPHSCTSNSKLQGHIRLLLC